MAPDDPVDVPLACSLTAAELRVRGDDNRSLFARAHSMRELPDGYSFAFAAKAGDARNLLAFVLAERACCPFFTFELAFPSPHQAIQLIVRGREGVKEIVRSSAMSAIATRTGVAEGAEPPA
ncbi:MAG: hypothetical protein ACHQ4H_10110 [Ktedonobacterales bacterium]